MATIASPMGTARMPTHGSWRPFVDTSVSLPVVSMVSRVLRIEEVGFTAKRATTGCPVEMPPRIPPALLDMNSGVPFGCMRISSAFSGEENADEMRMHPNGTPEFMSNNAGGILGGISTGQPVVARFAVKPTSSILNTRKTIDTTGSDTEVSTKGRHDPCVGIRAVPIGEAMVAIVLADHYLRHRGQTGQG